MIFLQAKNIYDAEKNATALHTQFGYVKNYCSREKIQDWHQKKVPVADRWVEIFQHFDAEDCEFDEIATIVEYIMCLPGSTAPVERIFAVVNKLWTEEKTRLHVRSLQKYFPLTSISHETDFLDHS